MQWAAMFGVGMILMARYFANLPFSIYPKSDFWLDSPAQVLIKLGVTFSSWQWLSLDSTPRGRMELGSPVRHHLAVGLLGPHRIGIRPLAALV